MTKGSGIFGYASTIPDPFGFAKTGKLEVIAGTGTAGNGTDSDPLKCAMNRLHGIFVDHDGSILIGDSEAHKVRVLRKK